MYDIDVEHELDNLKLICALATEMKMEKFYHMAKTAGDL